MGWTSRSVQRLGGRLPTSARVFTAGTGPVRERGGKVVLARTKAARGANLGLRVLECAGRRGTADLPPRRVTDARRRSGCRRGIPCRQEGPRRLRSLLRLLRHDGQGGLSIRATDRSHVKRRNVYVFQFT